MRIGHISLRPVGEQAEFYVPPTLLIRDIMPADIGGSYRTQWSPDS